MRDAPTSSATFDPGVALACLKETHIASELVRWVVVVLVLGIFPRSAPAEDFQRVPLQSKISQVQPFTGIVLWSDNDKVAQAPIQLEYAYLTYNKIATKPNEYDWSALEELLEAAAARHHQMIIRWHDTYVGHPTGVPAFITQQPGYKLTKGKSEGKPTEFPDWSHASLKRFAMEFFSRFAQKYDRDPRIAYVQVGFGLWSEYHIYDGPMILGKTFPSHDFQTLFLKHLAESFRQTQWMISVDAAGDWAPLAGNQDLLRLSFGVFDDSFNHAKHHQENEPNWLTLQKDRWKRAATGGEFSFFEQRDQARALSPQGPHGKSFETHAGDFHISFMIGDDQPRFQNMDRIRSAGMACGYRFRIQQFEASAKSSRVIVANTGIAPIYYDTYPTVNGVRSGLSLKGLLPNERAFFEIAAGGLSPQLTIDCSRLVQGQKISYEADLE